MRHERERVDTNREPCLPGEPCGGAVEDVSSESILTLGGHGVAVVPRHVHLPTETTRVSRRRVLLHHAHRRRRLETHVALLGQVLDPSSSPRISFSISSNSSSSPFFVVEDATYAHHPISFVLCANVVPRPRASGLWVWKRDVVGERWWRRRRRYRRHGERCRARAQTPLCPGPWGKTKNTTRLRGESSFETHHFRPGLSSLDPTRGK